MQNLPIYIYPVFILTVMTAVYHFSNASRSKIILLIVAGWMFFTGILALLGFFEVTHTLPPRFLVAVLPPLITFIILFLTPRSRNWIDSFDLKRLTILQTFRIPVEMILYWLFLHKLMPELMTFQGRNLDILSGLTAPLIYYIVFVKSKRRPIVLLTWNIVSLSLLLFTVSNGILSAPSAFQQFAFEQPNAGVLIFPFIWLPAVAVPIAYYAHIISIRLIWKQVIHQPGSHKTLQTELYNTPPENS